MPRELSGNLVRACASSSSETLPPPKFPGVGAAMGHEWATGHGVLPRSSAKRGGTTDTTQNSKPSLKSQKAPAARMWHVTVPPRPRGDSAAAAPPNPRRPALSQSLSLMCVCVCVGVCVRACAARDLVVRRSHLPLDLVVREHNPIWWCVAPTSHCAHYRQNCSAMPS
jgi:hypothetical protein